MPFSPVQRRRRYHLDTLSIAEGIFAHSGIGIDSEGNMRDDVAPDIGCYEYQ